MEQKLINIDIASNNSKCNEKCQSAMALSTEFARMYKAKIAKTFKKYLKFYDDIVDAAACTARDFGIEQGTEGMQYLLDYIYNRTGVSVCYWNDKLFISGEHFVDFILGDIMRLIDDVVAKSNYPKGMFDGENTLSVKESIAKELFLAEYHENSIY